MIRANTVFGEADVLALDCQIEGEAAELGTVLQPNA